jgi:hypothetical protein
MTKEELSKILHEACETVSEGVTPEKDVNTYPRIVYWDYVWDDTVASGKDYQEIDTYQVSFYARTPRHPDLIRLRQLLREVGVYLTIYHEYNEEDKVWHSYFAVEVVV